jgi:hypothetical protein
LSERQIIEKDMSKGNNPRGTEIFMKDGRKVSSKGAF